MHNPSIVSLLVRPLYYLLFPLVTLPIAFLCIVVLPLSLLKIYDASRNFSEKHDNTSSEPIVFLCALVWSVTTALNGMMHLVDYEVSWGGGLGWWGAVLGISSLQYLVVMVGLGGLVMVVGGMIMLGEKVGLLNPDEIEKEKKSDERKEGNDGEKEKEKEKEKDYLLVSRPEHSRRSIF